jgi:acyl-lipid omega-6 desaturase (Delta-12 desaturase)
MSGVVPDGGQAWVDSPLRDVVARYERPDRRRAVFELTVSAIGFVGLWYGMVRSLHVSYALTLALAVPTAGFLMRLFIIQHDCGHGSYFKTPWANDTVGRLIGVLSFTPYQYWRRHHAKHHSTSSMLDHRSEVDIPTLTVAEYAAASRWKRAGYRLVRNPVILFAVAPLLHFVLWQRIPFIAPRAWRAERRSIWETNAALIALLAAFGFALGPRQLFLIELPVLWIATSTGLWIFYVHHQFEDTCWVRDRRWSFELAGMRGASHYALPAFLRWFTLNIGIHHIHHLSTRVPGYRLHACLVENPALQGATQLTLRGSLRCLFTRLWDERRGRMVGFP